MHRFCNLVYGWAIQRIEPEKREEWDYMLTAPFPGETEVVSEFRDEDEGASFMAMMGQGQ